MVHAGINFSNEIKKQHKKDLLWISEGFIDVKNTSKYIIVFGHTITRSISNNFIKNTKDRILKFDRKIAIDCACISHGKLGCIRLDDMEEFYVEKYK